METFALSGHLAALAPALARALTPGVIVDRHPAYAQMTAELEISGEVAGKWIAHLIDNWSDGAFPVHIAEIVESHWGDSGADTEMTDDEKLDALRVAAERVFEGRDEMDGGKYFAVPVSGDGGSQAVICVAYTTGTEEYPCRWHGAAASAETLWNALRGPGIVLSVSELEAIPREARLAAIAS